MKEDFITHRFQMDSKIFLKELISAFRMLSCKGTDVIYKHKEDIYYCIFGLLTYKQF
jgi:hypothetical protein